MTTPAATIVICTRDRPASLDVTLRSLVAASEAVGEPWELVVVDNGETGGTLATVEAFRDRLPIRLEREPVPGLSRARNRGVAAARGRYLVWTDDDVTVEPGWLAAYLEAFRRWPDHALFGGWAMPHFEEPVNPWFVAMRDELGSLLAIRNETSWDEITTDRVPYGLNYAMRAEEQRAHLYDPELGVAPGRRRGGEETHMIRRALADGARGRWVWDARVHHRIPSSRQTARYVFEYYRAHGADHPVVALKDREPGLAVTATVGLEVGRKALGTGLKLAAGRRSWIRSYVDLARSVGTADRLRRNQSG
jgi:glucosyl-dolichyl phosphate glucuronosyltransferase